MFDIRKARKLQTVLDPDLYRTHRHHLDITFCAPEEQRAISVEPLATKPRTCVYCRADCHQHSTTHEFQYISLVRSRGGRPFQVDGLVTAKARHLTKAVLTRCTQKSKLSVESRGWQMLKGLVCAQSQ